MHLKQKICILAAGIALMAGIMACANNTANYTTAGSARAGENTTVGIASDNTVEEVYDDPEISFADVRNTVSVSYNKGTAIVSVNISDNRLDVKAFSYDNGKTWNNSHQYAYKKNGLVYIRVRDKNKNEIGLPLALTDIDGEKPKIRADVSENYIYVSVSDNNSVTKLERRYQEYTEEKALDAVELWHGCDQGFRLENEVSKNGIYTYIVTDKAGNKAQIAVDILLPEKETSMFTKDMVDQWTSVQKKTDEDGNVSVYLVCSIPEECMSLLDSKPFSWNEGDWTKERLVKIETDGRYQLRLKTLDGDVVKSSIYNIKLGIFDSYKVETDEVKISDGGIIDEQAKENSLADDYTNEEYQYQESEE